MSASYRRLSRKLDEAEDMLTQLRADVLLLALEIKRIEDGANVIATRPLRLAYKIMGLPRPTREQMGLIR